MGKAIFRFLSWCPGLLGLYLRQKLFPRFLGSCGRRVLFGRFIRLAGGKNIHIGDNSVISDYVSLDGRGGGGNYPAISIGSRVFLGKGCRLRSRKERIVIGQGSSLGSFCLLAAPGSVSLEEKVLLAAFCRLGPVPKGERRPAGGDEGGQVRGREIVVGRGSWLGVRSQVLPGVRVGAGTVVGAHALVRNALPDNAVAVGRPARVLRERREGNGG